MDCSSKKNQYYTKEEASEAMTNYLRSVKAAAEVRKAAGLDPEVNVETEEKVEVAQ